jgi:hypothetical protein
MSPDNRRQRPYLWAAPYVVIALQPGSKPHQEDDPPRTLQRVAHVQRVQPSANRHLECVSDRSRARPRSVFGANQSSLKDPICLSCLGVSPAQARPREILDGDSCEQVGSLSWLSVLVLFRLVPHLSATPGNARHHTPPRKSALSRKDERSAASVSAVILAYKAGGGGSNPSPPTKKGPGQRNRSTSRPLCSSIP